MIPGYVDASLKGTAYGVYYLVVGSCFFVANTVVGWLWETHGLGVSTLYSGILASIAIVGMIFLNKKN